MKKFTRKFLKTNGDLPGFAICFAIMCSNLSDNMAVSFATHSNSEAYTKETFQEAFSTLDALNKQYNEECLYSINFMHKGERVVVSGTSISPCATFVYSDSYDITEVENCVKKAVSDRKKNESLQKVGSLRV